MQITKKQISRVEDAKKETLRFLNKELAYSEDLQKAERIEELRAHVAKLDKMIAEAV